MLLPVKIIYRLFYAVYRLFVHPLPISSFHRFVRLIALCNKNKNNGK